MRVRCPHCRAPVEITAETRLSEIACPSCQSHFSLDVEETAVFDLPRVAATRRPPTPAAIGPFELLKHIGSGAVGEVWKARDTRLGRIVAVKFLGPADSEFSGDQMVQHEAELTGLLDHPSIAAALEVSIADGQLYVLSEYIEGQQLDKFCLERQGSIREAVVICAQLARALDHAHQRGVIHRDLKPQNIIIDPDGKPHILDFGLATHNGQTTATDGMLVGTPAYMAPEQLAGRPIDERVDVYALGLILYELLTGERPFRGDDGHNLLYQIAHQEVPAPSSINDRVSPSLDRICLTCLARNPQHRYSSAGELATALDHFLSNEALATSPAQLDLRAEVARLTALNQSLQAELRDRTRMFIATKAEHQLYQSLVESLPLCVFRKDLEGRFVFANDFFCKTVSRQLDEVKGRMGHDLFPAQVAAKQQSEEAKVIATGNVVESTEEHAADSGMTTYFEVLKSPVRNFKGEIVGVQGMMWDISTHTQAEAVLRKAMEAAEAANRAKSEFLANMSHEIPTPMTAIIGMTDLLSQRQRDQDDRKLMRTVQDAAEALLVIIDEILDFSKIEARRLDLECVDIDLHELLENTVNALATPAQSKGIRLRHQIAGDVPRWVSGDPVRFRQILLNLVGNAVKFTQQGEVSVLVERNTRPEMRADTTTPAERSEQEVVSLHCMISDTGVGIPDDKRAIIFAPFEQADGSITRRYGGTGLGLAVSSRLVELMGGRIWVENKAGGGSIFHFTVNLQPSTVATALHILAAQAVGGAVSCSNADWCNGSVVGGGSVLDSTPFQPFSYGNYPHIKIESSCG